MQTLLDPKCLLEDPVLQNYFQSFNAGAFEQTASLFVTDGVLQAPFEEPIVGRSEIVRYLEREAHGMKAKPQFVQTTTNQEGRKVVVKGRVKALIFNVNIAWTFQINHSDRIQAVEVELLASLQDLIQFRPA